MEEMRLCIGRQKRGIIRCNPSAAHVWLSEKRNGAPWREKAERMQQIEDERAMKEHMHKRLTLLAKQTCLGLKRMYQTHFDVAELIPILADAEKESQKLKPNPKSMALLQAVHKFDLGAVSHLLKSYDKNDQPLPCLGIMNRKPRFNKPMPL